MTLVTALLFISSATLTGRVMGLDGQALSATRVFLEVSLTANVVEAPISADGSFRFEDVAQGMAGVFAIADGCGFSGVSVTLAAGEEPQPVEIHLSKADTVKGVIVDSKGKSVDGALITRFGILGASKVGIPLAKLKAFGFDTPTSDTEGRFTVTNAPSGAIIALKVGHSRFAQEAVDNVAVGATDVQITLQTGVLLRGEVFTRSQQATVANADIVVRNASPPFDTAVSRTDARGAFAVRLKSGAYLFQASSSKYRSPAWERLVITGEQAEQKARLTVAGLGRIAGEVRDAKSEAPVVGAKIVLQAGGNTAAIARTGRTGKFELDATEGENIVTLESAAGYLPPERVAVRANVVEGQTVELPTYWLAALPTIQIQVVDSNLQPVAHSVVTLLQPAQFGWRISGGDGIVRLSFSSLPPGGAVIGVAEHPTMTAAALFAVRPSDEAPTVQLLELASATGAVNGKGDKPIEGAIAGAAFADENTVSPIFLWKTPADEQGFFSWPAIIPHVPFKCVATAGPSASGELPSVMLEEKEHKDLGRIVIEEGASSRSMRGKPLKWYNEKVICGPTPTAEQAASRTTVVFYCGSKEATEVIESVAQAAVLFPSGSISFAVGVEGPFTCSEAACIVFSSRPPALATTYVVDKAGLVVLETFGFPPLASLQAAAREGL